MGRASGRGAWPRGPRTFGVVLGAAIVLAAVPSCSIIVDTNSDQCETTADCSAFPGSACVDKVCVGPGTGGGGGGTGGSPPECATNQECVDKNGQYQICRKSDFQCVGLLNAQCTVVDGNYLDDNAFMIGSVLPTTGDDEATGKSEENGIRLAINDFTTTSNGLPPRPGTSARRPVVLIGCSDDGDAPTAVTVARHLVDDVGLSAIIGAAYSGITIKMTTEVTIPASVLTISPSATSADITTLADDDLVWRTSPSDVFQAAGLAAYVEERLEGQIRGDLMLMAGDKVKMAILHKADSYGARLAEALEAQTTLNGQPVVSQADDYKRVDYGDPDNPEVSPPNYQAAIDAALALKPHVIAIIGTTEAVIDVLQPIEAGWDAGTPYRPRYLFADGGYVDALWGYVGTNDALRKRISGSVPGTTSSLFNAFRNKYISKYGAAGPGGPDVFGAAGAYDATYLLAYAAVANAANPETGPNLVAALKRMVGPENPIDVGPANISAAFQKLSVADAKIDFTGSSGPLNFDVDTGEAPSDVQIWCLPTDPNGAADVGTFSSIYLDAASLTLQGPAQFGPQCEFN